MSPVELRQFLLEEAIDELSKNESNVVQDIVVHRVIERVINSAMPYLDSRKDEPAEKVRWRDYWRARWFGG